MAATRLLLTFAMAGALLGLLVVSLVWPPLLTWNNTSAAGQALCDCAKVTRDTAETLIKAQLVGGAVGAVLGAVLGGVVAFKRRTPSTPPPAA